MSCNRENDTWQSEDGKWNVGFFDYTYTGGEDGDYEWDVEYDFSRFNFVSTGHDTQAQARDAWDGANPGGTTIYALPHDDERTKKHVADLERMALEALERSLDDRDPYYRGVMTRMKIDRIKGLLEGG